MNGARRGEGKCVQSIGKVLWSALWSWDRKRFGMQLVFVDLLVLESNVTIASGGF